MKRGKLLFAWLAVTAVLGAVAAFGVIDGTKYANSYQPITFPNLTAADTTESVRCLPLHKTIAYYIKVTSRHFDGLMTSDTVYVRLCASPEDSNYTNVAIPDTLATYTALGTYAIIWNSLSASKFTRIEIPRMTDSLRVQIKAIISPQEGR
mgnify:CR=1 FL=1